MLAPGDGPHVSKDVELGKLLKAKRILTCFIATLAAGTSQC
jgi:hypothetical protein